MADNFPYKSLHEYLDKVFSGTSASEIEITKAKKEYWKAYNTHLKQKQRRKCKEVTLAFDKKEWQSLLERLNPNQSLHGYIKELLNHHSNNAPIATSTIIQDTTQIEQQLFLVTDYLEGLVYQRRHIDSNSIAGLEHLLQELQQLLEDKF